MDVSGFAAFIAVLFFCGSLLAGTAMAAGPNAYITENVYASYFYNGTIASNTTRTGFIDVSVPNTQDVLQYMRATLSGVANTNLQSTTAYKDVAASPMLGDRTRIYLYTTESSADIIYNITNENIAPVFMVIVNHQNYDGGTDLFDGVNKLQFNVSIDTTSDATNVNLYFRVGKDTSGSNDSVELDDVYASSGFSQTVDSDSDTINDEIFWSGNINSGSPVQVNFEGITEPGTNFDSLLMFLDMDTGTETATEMTLSSTFTGIFFTDWFSRGPIREGIELYRGATWSSRGFVKNIATGLDYIVHSWEFYQVGNAIPLLAATIEQSMTPNQTIYTDWYETGSPDIKGYYSSAFDWEVIWDAYDYTGTSKTITLLPTLYVLDTWSDKSAVFQSNSGGTSVAITDRVRHIGHSNTEVGNVEIYSPISASFREFDPSNVKVYFYDGTTQYDITLFCTIDTQGATQVADGYVDVNVTNMYAAIGRPLRQNEDIIVTYTLSGSASLANQDTEFCTNTTMKTLSGTPNRDSDCEIITIPAIPSGEQPPTGGGAPFVTKPHAEIVKESVQTVFLTANSIEVTSVAKIIDYGGKGIQNVKVLVYTPNDAVTDMESFIFRIYDASQGLWIDYEKDVDFVIEYRGVTDFEGLGAYSEFLIKKKERGEIYETGIDLSNNDKVEIKYETTIPYGTWFFITRVSGYNYYTDKIVFEDIEIPVRRELDEEVLVIKEGAWVQGNAIVGRPVPWTKTIQISNPGQIPIEYRITSGVFHDTLSAYIIYDDQKEKLSISKDGHVIVDWVARIGPEETNNYTLLMHTPPVIEIDRNLSSNKLNETDVEFLFTSVIQNFGEEAYVNVTTLFPIEREKIISVKTDKGVALEYVEGQRGIDIIIPVMQPNETMTIYIDFISKLPIIITRPNALQYECSEYAFINITLIPSENETHVYLEVELIGPKPLHISRYADIITLYSLEPWKDIELYFQIDLSFLPDGEYKLKTTLKKGFLPLVTDEFEFDVNCPIRNILLNAETIVVIVISGALVLVAYVIVRVKRKRGFQRGIEDLRGRLKDLGI